MKRWSWILVIAPLCLSGCAGLDTLNSGLASANAAGGMVEMGLQTAKSLGETVKSMTGSSEDKTQVHYKKSSKNHKKHYSHKHKKK